MILRDIIYTVYGGNTSELEKITGYNQTTLSKYLLSPSKRAEKKILDALVDMADPYQRAYIYQMLVNTVSKHMKKTEIFDTLSKRTGLHYRTLSGYYYNMRMPRKSANRVMYELYKLANEVQKTHNKKNST